MLVVLLWWLLSQRSKCWLFYGCALKDFRRLVTGAFTLHHSDMVMRYMADVIQTSWSLPPCYSHLDTQSPFHTTVSATEPAGESLFLSLTPVLSLWMFSICPSHLAWDKVKHSSSLTGRGGKCTETLSFTYSLQGSLCGILFCFTRVYVEDGYFL